VNEFDEKEGSHPFEEYRRRLDRVRCTMQDGGFLCPQVCVPPNIISVGFRVTGLSVKTDAFETICDILKKSEGTLEAPLSELEAVDSKLSGVQERLARVFPSFVCRSPLVDKAVAAAPEQMPQAVEPERKKDEPRGLWAAGLWGQKTVSALGRLAKTAADVSNDLAVVAGEESPFVSIGRSFFL